MKRIFAIVACLLVCLAGVLPALADTRVTWYFSENPTDAKYLQMERDQRITQGVDRYAIFGGTGYANLTVTPAGGLTVTIAPAAAGIPGAVYVVLPDDVNAWGGGPIGGTGLTADATNLLVQGAIPSASSPLGPLSVPSTSGQSQISLIECTASTQDATPTGTIFTTANGSRATYTVSRDRADVVTCQAKAGTAASSPVAPSVDSGYVGVATVTIPYGTSTVTSLMVAMLPVIGPQNVTLYPSGLAAPASSGQATFPGSQSYSFPAGLSTTTLSATASLTTAALTVGSLNGCLSASSGVVSASTCASGTVTGLTAGSNIVAGTGATPTVAVTAAPSFATVTVSGLTPGNCVQAGTGGVLTTISGSCGTGSGTINSVTAGSNAVVTGTSTAPVVGVTAAPSFSSLTSTAGLTSGSSSYGPTSATVNGPLVATTAMLSGKITTSSTGGILASAGPLAETANTGSPANLFALTGNGIMSWNASGGSGEVDLYNAYSSSSAPFEFWQSNGTTAVSLSSITNTGTYSVGSSYFGATQANVNGLFEANNAYFTAVPSDGVAIIPTSNANVAVLRGTNAADTANIWTIDALGDFYSSGGGSFASLASAGGISGSYLTTSTIFPTSTGGFFINNSTNSLTNFISYNNGAAYVRADLSANGGHVAPFFQLSGADIGTSFHGVRVTGTTSATTTTCGPFTSSYCATITMPTGTAAFSSVTTSATSFDCGEGDALASNLYWLHDFGAFAVEWNTTTTLYVSGSSPSQAFAFECKGT